MNSSGLSAVLPRDETQLILMGGLPGSGKTHFANTLERSGWIFYDDFQQRTPGNSILFRDSRCYTDLLSNLRQGRRCIVSDIRIVFHEYRDDAETSIRQDLGQVLTELHLFENAPEQCAKNVHNARDGRRVEPRLEAIAHWSKYYSAPPHAIVHTVWRPSEGQCKSMQMTSQPGRSR